jgi:hypothetical protein
MPLRRAATLVELATCLALSGLVLAALALPGGARAPGSDHLAAVAEWIVHDLTRSQEVLAPRPAPGTLASSLAPELRLRGSGGEIEYRFDRGIMTRRGPEGVSRVPMAAAGFQLRARGAGIEVVRVRLANDRWVLLAGERVGSCPHGS